MLQLAHTGKQLADWTHVQTACAKFKASFLAEPRIFTKDDYMMLEVATNWLVEQALNCSTEEALAMSELDKHQAILAQDTLNGLKQAGDMLQIANRGTTRG